MKVKRGDLNAALQEVDSASQRLPDTQSDWFWRFRGIKAEILMLQGHYQDSLNLLDGKLPERLQDSDVAAWQRMTQAAASAFLFRPEAAHSFLDQAEKIIRSTQPQVLGDLTLRKGSLAFLAGDSRQAFSLYMATREIAKSNKDPFLEAAALGSLGLVSTSLERYDESIDWNKQALDLSRSIDAKNSIARIQGNIGWSYHEMGDLDNALQQFRLAAKDAQKLGNVSDQSYWLNSEAAVLYDLHDYAGADSASKEALALSHSLNDERTVIECLQTRALVAIAMSAGAEARNAIDEATRLQAAAPDPKRDPYTALLAAHLDAQARNLHVAERAYSGLARDQRAPASLRWEAQAGLAQVHAAQREYVLAEKEFSQSIETISSVRNSIQQEDFRLSFLSSAIRFYDEYVNLLLSQNRPLDALRIADLSRAQTLERGLSSSNGKTQKAKAPLSFHPQDIARRQNASLLFYWIGQSHSFVWVITPAKVTLLPLPARDEIDATTAAYRKSFLDPRDPLESGNPDGKKLYDILVRPAEKFIPKNSRVIILPDGSLTGLNFETLIVSACPEPCPARRRDPQPHYWIDDATVSVASSLSLLARSRPSPPPQKNTLLFFGDALSAGRDFPPLADSQQELAALNKHFPAERSAFFTRERAAPSIYLSSNPGAYTYLHFATHGTASIARPLESAIILSPEKDGAYKLYARDIVTRPLNAYLVSISACNGSGERVLAGEGLVGLSWAFLRAGAHNVVAGLWEVSTSSAPQIFDGLYDGINKGQDPATALRNAKLSLVHSKGPHRRPFYWAPFQLYSGS